MSFSNCRSAKYLSVLAAMVLIAGSVEAGSKRARSVRPIRNPQFDPSADRVELFKGMEDGRLATKVIAQDPQHGVVLVTNNSDESLTVELPQAFVAVQVMKQFGGGGQLGGGGGFGGQQGGQQGGQNQNAGGGFGGQQGGGQLGGAGGGAGGGQGFFSVPPEKTVSVPYVSACLNHGKKDPNPRVNYQIVPVDSYTKDPVLAEMIGMVGTGRLEPQSAQAAIWTRTDNMSWQQLAAKSRKDALGRSYAYFNYGTLQRAQMITATAEARVREREKAEQSDDTTPRERAVISRVQ